MRPPDPDNRRRQVAKILRSARRQFARDGYDRVSMDRIAAACGSTKPVLSYTLENKRAVLLAVLEAHWAEQAALLEAFRPSEDLRATLGALARAANLHRSRGRHLHPGQSAPPGAMGPRCH
jgi:AcrR family transcriptional regulator